MGYFPIFIDLKSKDILVIGAGQVASRKIEKLLPFSPKLTVVAPRISEEVRVWAQNALLALYERPFQTSDLGGQALVIVAVDDVALQKEVFEACQRAKVPCNSVDSPLYCSFIFPALVTRGDLTIGISTGGRAPRVSGQIRKVIDEVLPENISEIVDSVGEFRKSAQVKALSTFTERAQRVGQLVDSLLGNFQKALKEKTNSTDSKDEPPHQQS